MRAQEINLIDAKENKLFYFVANAVVYRESDARCLILKRDKREKVHPGKWAVVGGKLEWDDLDLQNPGRAHGDVLDYPNAVEDLLVREAHEEAGVIIDTSDMRYINSVAFVRPDGIPVVMVKFGVRYVSGEVVPEKGAFTDYAWVSVEELKEYDCLLGIEEEVAKTVVYFKK